MKILVTGDKGFIGSHLSKSLINDGHEVIGWDKKDDKDILHITSDDIGYAERIVHLAAKANVKQSLKYPTSYHITNTLGTRAVFEAAEYVGVPVIIGEKGIEKIIELKLDADEQKSFQTSIDAVRELFNAAKKIDPSLA